MAGRLDRLEREVHMQTSQRRGGLIAAACVTLKEFQQVAIAALGVIGVSSKPFPVYEGLI
jgi:hypothetical protein